MSALFGGKKREDRKDAKPEVAGPEQPWEIVERLDKRGLLHIAEAVSDETGILVTSLVGTSRMQEIVAARHLFWRRLRDASGLGYAAMGRLLGRDHATILYALKEGVRNR